MRRERRCQGVDFGRSGERAGRVALAIDRSGHGRSGAGFLAAGGCGRAGHGRRGVATGGRAFLWRDPASSWRDGAFIGRDAREDDGGKEPRQEAGKGGERRGELRRGHLRRRHQEADLVSRRVDGVGLGLRWDFVDALVARVDASGPGAAAGDVPIDFLEIAPENYMGRGGRYPAALRRLAERFSVVTHGLTMSLGGADPLDDAYLADLRVAVTAAGSPWHSDHMCFGSAQGRSLHDLLPIAFKRASVGRVAERIRRARDVLGVPLAVENVSYYWHPGRADVGEAEFLAAVCDAADCGLLLDVNNAYVNATNFGFDVDAWLRAAPLDRVVQIHVAGHEWFDVDARGLGAPAVPHAPGAMIIDTHGADIVEPVLAILARVLERTGPVPIVVERDQNVPDLDDLLAEVARVRAVADRVRLQPGLGRGARAEDDAARAEHGE
jgi:uncharacterized protein (UPF0276 family)